MGLKLLDRIWCTRLSVDVLGRHGIAVDDLEEWQLQTFVVLMLSLKEGGFSKRQAAVALEKLFEKHGGLFEALEAYADALEIPKVAGIGLLNEFESFTNSIAESLGVGAEGAKNIREAALSGVSEPRTAKISKTPASSKFQELSNKVPRYYRLASFIAKDHGVNESVIVDMIKDGKIAGAKVEGYWRVDTRSPLDSLAIRAYMFEQAQRERSHASATPGKKKNVEKVVGEEVVKKERFDVFDGEEPSEVGVVAQFLRSFEGHSDLSEHLSEREMNVLQSVARLSLEKGMAPGMAVDSLSVLAEKHGGIRNLVARYSKAVKK